METNRLPPLHEDDNPTGCCPRFHPEDWADVTLHFRNKRFLRVTVRSLFHIPLDMGPVFTRTNQAIEAAKAYDPGDFIVLSRDLSPWKSEHLFAVTHDLPGAEMTTLSGDFITRVFEGPYRMAPAWAREMQAEAARQGAPDAAIWFYYTTCPKCAKAHGRNYVVALASV